MRKFLSIAVFLLSISLSSYAQWDKDVFSFRGRLALQDGKYSSAIEHFNVLARLDSTDYWTFFYRGIAKYNLGDLRGAQADFDRSVNLNPVFTDGYHFRAITESRSGRSEAALEDLQKAIELRPGNVGLYFSRGVANFLARKFEDALKDFDYFIRKEPKEAGAYLNRGATKLFLGDTLAAVNDYNKAIRLDKKDAEGYIRRGRVYAMQKRYDEAIKDMDDAIQRDSENTMAYFTRAIMEHEKYDYNAAMKDFNKVLELEPGNALTLYNRSLLYAQVGDFQSAIEDMDRVIAINPDNVLAHYNRAAFYMETGRYQDAVDDYSYAIALYPDFANAYMNRSVAELRLGRNRASKSDYNTAKRKVADYHAANSSGAASYADTTKKYSALLELDGEFEKKDFNDELLQHRDIDVQLSPLFKFMLSDNAESVNQILSHDYENALLDRFISRSPVPVTISNNDSLATFTPEHGLDFLLAGDSATGAGDSPLTGAEEHFLKALDEIQNKQYDKAMENLDIAVRTADNEPGKDRYSKYYKAFYLLSRAMLKAEMTEFLSNIENNVQTLKMDDKGATNLRVRDHITNDYDYSGAIEDLLEAAKVLPQFPYTFFNLGNLYCLSSNPVEAINYFTRAIELFPEMGEAYLNRGLVQILVQDKEKGCMDFSKAGELGVKDAYGIIRKYCREDEQY